MTSGTRARILDTGLNLFHSKGYTATGVNDIAREAGVPKGSFYHFFESKESLAVETVEKYTAAAMEDLDSDAGSPALQRVRGHLDRRTTAAERHDFARGCLLGNFATEMPPNSEQVSAVVSAAFDVWERKLAKVIAVGQASGEITAPQDALVLARFTIGGFEGALAQAKLAGSREPLDQFSDVLFAAVLV